MAQTQTFKLVSNGSRNHHRMFTIEYANIDELFEKLMRRIGTAEKIHWKDAEKDRIILEDVADLREALKYSKEKVEGILTIYEGAGDTDSESSFSDDSETSTSESESSTDSE